jgi:hypothetical protein
MIQYADAKEQVPRRNKHLAERSILLKITEDRN